MDVIPKRLFRGFPKRLHHDVPSWVEGGALFHVRIALDRTIAQTPLTDPVLAPDLLDAARFYHSKQRWYVTFFLPMPDHLHALLTFPAGESMSEVVRDWKRFHHRKHHVQWQEGYFDHRLRDDELGKQLEIKVHYIQQNPVVAGLCARAEEWPWKIDHAFGGSAYP